MKQIIWIFSISIIFGLATSCDEGTKSTTENIDSTTTDSEAVISNAEAVVSNSEAETSKSQLGQKDNQQQTKTVDIKPEYLTAAEFKAKIWDYENDPEGWAYKGDLPCVVDFYADWCKPCKMVAPIMDDLADYYDGRVKIYKVNTDKERELSTVFQIRSIPAILFAPSEGKPAMQPGALSREEYIKIIDEFVLKIDNNNNNKTAS